MSVRRALILLLAALPAVARVLPPGIRPFRTYGTEAGLGNLAAMRLAFARRWTRSSPRAK